MEASPVSWNPATTPTTSDYSGTPSTQPSWTATLVSSRVSTGFGKTLSGSPKTFTESLYWKWGLELDVSQKSCLKPVLRWSVSIIQTRLKRIGKIIKGKETFFYFRGTYIIFLSRMGSSTLCSAMVFSNICLIPKKLLGSCFENLGNGGRISIDNYLYNS